MARTWAHVLVDQCANKSILRLDSEPTARWAAEFIGQYEAREYHTSESTSSSGWSQSVNEQIVSREAVLASELLSLPQVDDSGFHGYHVIPLLGVYRTKVDFKPILCGRAKVEDFVPRGIEEQYLEPWSAEDRQRLGLPGDDDAPADPVPTGAAATTRQAPSPPSSMTFPE